MQPGMQHGQQPGQHMTNNRTINIKQSPDERRKVLTERNKEIRPEHNVRAARDFRDERNKFRPVHKEFVRSSPEIQHRVFEHNHFEPETYYARRSVFYETYQFHTPFWAFSLQPRYGLWDTPALAFILAHIADEQYALWYYNHRFDPDVIVWRQDMDRLAADNADLSAQLAIMDNQMNVLQARSVPVDNSYVPPEMKDVALTEEVAAPQQPQSSPAMPQQYQEPQQQQPPQQGNSTEEMQRRLEQMQEQIDRLQQQNQNTQQP